MTPVTTFSGKSLALFGLGGSGRATARALVAGGADLVVFDDKAESVEAARAEGLDARDLRTLDWSGIDALILSPGVPLTHPEPHWSVILAQAAGAPVIGDVELFVRERRALAPGSPFVAITGTNGKSTTTALIAHILKTAGRDVQLGGNIGTPVLALEPPAENRVHVVECSSYQIDLAPTLDPSVGLLLNLAIDHIDRHGSFEHYGAVKERLVAASDHAVIGVDDAASTAVLSRRRLSGKPASAISHHLPAAKDAPSDGVFADGTLIVVLKDGAARVVADLAGHKALRGAHNMQNASAAVAACLALGLEDRAIAAGLASFPGLAHRMEPLGSIGNVLFVNDSKATNADAAARALDSYERIYWIAGGRAKSDGIDPLNGFFSKIVKAYLIGEAMERFAGTLQGKVETVMAGDLASATRLALADALCDAGRDPVVLLSPACASWDQFASFEARGEAFRRLVDEARRAGE
ncbi:MAG: UDP-N-acetylmuramoyl-L-alanine--D-glutamate ligase [Hyphomicrobiaceae bacterium]|nr:UDP-N-acetylmuramoyl-L-alanine--D-glutamate ligase [Hyphomicrobiaceae bacterium]